MSGPDHRRADNGAARVGDVVARSSEPTLDSRPAENLDTPSCPSAGPNVMPQAEAS